MSGIQTPGYSPIDADSVETFSRVLDSADTSTGGGTASALVGAMGSSLIGLVASISRIGAGNGAEEICQMVSRSAEQLKVDLLLGGREDSQAFAAVRDAYRMPKGSDLEKRVRSEQIQHAILHATRVPLANAKLCLQVLELAQQIFPLTKPSVASDFLCAKLFAQAGFQGCMANLEINLPQIRDLDASRELAKEAEELRSLIKKYEKNPAQ